MHYTDIHKEKTREAFNRQADTFDTKYKGSFGRLQRKSFESIIGHLETIQFGSILDVGCGTGLLLERIKNRWFDVKISGIDISPGMLAIARQRLGETADLKIGDAEELPWPNANFDVVVTTSVFHHFTHPVKALIEMKRILKPDGHLLLLDVTSPALLRQIGNLFLPLSPEGDVKIYSKKEIMNLLNKSGFKMIEWSTLSIWLYLVVAVPLN